MSNEINTTKLTKEDRKVMEEQHAELTENYERELEKARKVLSGERSGYNGYTLAGGILGTAATAFVTRDIASTASAGIAAAAASFLTSGYDREDQTAKDVTVGLVSSGLGGAAGYAGSKLVELMFNKETVEEVIETPEAQY